MMEHFLLRLFHLAIRGMGSLPPSLIFILALQDFYLDLPLWTLGFVVHYGIALCYLWITLL
jgi:hypothetical protein